MRSRWSEGLGPRRTRVSRTSTGRRTGRVCPNVWIVYEREQKVTKQNGLRAFSWLKRDTASGIDGATWKDYEANQETKLADLHQRLYRRGYRTLPSKRKYIPKTDGRLRPLGTAALEDAYFISPPPAQGVQRAVVEVLNVIYERRTHAAGRGDFTVVGECISALCV